MQIFELVLEIKSSGFLHSIHYSKFDEREVFFLIGSNCNENMTTYTNSYLYDKGRNCHFARARTVCGQKRQPRHYKGEFIFLPLAT
jgi:hypothetical protein